MMEKTYMKSEDVKNLLFKDKLIIKSVLEFYTIGKKKAPIKDEEIVVKMIPVGYEWFFVSRSLMDIMRQQEITPINEEVYLPRNLCLIKMIIDKVEEKITAYPEEPLFKRVKEIVSEKMGYSPSYDHLKENKTSDGKQNLYSEQLETFRLMHV